MNLVSEANKHLIRIDAQSESNKFRDDIFAEMGQLEGNIIVGDNVAMIQAPALEVIQALEALPDKAGWQAAWEALLHFPDHCDCGCCGMCDDNDSW